MIKRTKTPQISINSIWFDFWNFDPGNDIKCKAYPNGIPDLIISSEVNHKRPYTNDKNIQYEKTQIVAGNLEERRILQMETFE